LPAPVDVVLIVQTYYEFDDPQTLLRKLRESLKPGGRIGVVEFTKNGYGPGPLMEDRVDPEQVIREAEAAGLRLKSRGDFLPYQYLLEFVAADPK
jgi:SAM-dependent methyltransferase